MNRSAPARRRGGPVAVAALALVFFALSAAAALAQQLPKGRLASVFPAGARQGTTLEVDVGGDDLLDVTKLYFSHPGISAEKLADGRRFKVTVVPEVPIGYYDVRVAGKFGITNPRTFVVGEWPEVVEQEPNDLAAKAMRIELGTIVNGRSMPAEDVDMFVFSAKAGQRVLVECHATRIDSQLDSSLWLYDSTGRQLAASQDEASRNEKLDPLINYTIPTDGDYVVKLADFVYNGNGNCFYRLSVGTPPLVDFVLPTGGKPGETQQFTIYGRNLPEGEQTDLTIGGRPLEKITRPIALPPEAASTLPLTQFEAIRPYCSELNGTGLTVRGPGGLSNARLVLASSLPEVLEQEPNTSPADAQRLTVPAAVSGQFSPVKDVDYYTFAGKKGETYSIEVYSERLGSPTDVDMEVLDAKEKVIASAQDENDNIGSNRFRTVGTDLRYDLTPQADGDYTIRLEHLYGQNQGGPQFVYRLELAPKVEDFQAVCLPLHEQRRDSDVVRQGGRERLDIVVWRLRGHNAPITVTAENLPPGVTAEPVIIAPKMKQGTLILTAAPDAPLGEAQFKLMAKSQVGGVEVEREVRGGTGVWDTANTPLVARMARSLMLAVRESAPFKLTATTDTPTVKQGEPLVVNCHVDRRSDLSIDIQLSARGFPPPPGLEVPVTKIAAGQSDAVIKIATDKVPPATYSMPINGEGQVPFAKEPGKNDPIRCVMPSNLVTFTILPKDGK